MAFVATSLEKSFASLEADALLSRLEQNTATDNNPVRLRASFSVPGQIIGTPNADNIIGTANTDNIVSLAGDDTVSGGDGKDNISAGAGSDLVFGGDGTDIVFGDYSPSGNSDFINSGNDTLFGEGGSDELYGQDGNDFLDGGAGKDFLEGGQGDDNILGKGGDDIILGDDFEKNPSVSGNDTISGGNGNDAAYGGRGNDIIAGDKGDDTLIGEQGSDTISGGDDSDILVGTDISFFGQPVLGFGFSEIDVLTGGASNDTFVLGLAEANGRDANGNNGTLVDVVLYNDGNNTNSNGIRDYARITDFTSGEDIIELAGAASSYSLGASPVIGIAGTGVFFTEGQAVPELIAIIENVASETLSLANSTQFSFV